MTLHTQLRVKLKEDTTLSTEKVFNAGLERLIEGTDFTLDTVQTFRYEDDKFWAEYGYTGMATVIGQGLPAIFDVMPVKDEDGAEEVILDEDDSDYGYGYEESYEAPEVPEADLVVGWDTAYAAKMTNPYNGSTEGVGDMHVRFIVTLGTWLDMLPEVEAWYWLNEFTGDWTEGATGLEELGAGGEEALAWMNTVVFPAIKKNFEE